MAARLPLRVVPQAQLRKAWSEGRTFYSYPGRPPRDLEKPIEAMTLDELIATQDREPLSESRRSFLATRQGVWSLDAPAANGSAVPLIEFVGDDAPKCLFDAVDDGLDLDDDLDIAERDAARYGVPYQTVDFVTGRQIEWEREQSQHGPVVHVAIGANAEGKLSLKSLSRLYPELGEFPMLARQIVTSLFASVGRVSTLDELHERVMLIQDAMDDPVAHLYRDPEPREEADRYLAPDDEIAHSSVEALDEDGNVVIHHRSPRRSIENETWHHQLDRSSSAPLELGFDLCSDDELESLLGVQAWDENGMPIAS